MKSGIRRLQCVLLMVGAATSLVASELTIPHTFTSGTPALAAQVNANFAATREAVNDNDARIDQLLAQVQALSATVTGLQNQLDDLEDASAGSNIAMGLLNSAVPAVQQLRVRPGVTVTAAYPQVGRVELQISGADTAQAPIAMITPHGVGSDAPTCNTRLLQVNGPTDYTVRIDCYSAAGAAQNTSFQFLIAD
jgi:hypothetical protein